MRDRCRHFFLCDAVAFGICDMVFQGSVCDTLRGQDHNGQQGSGFQIQIFIVPVLTKQDIVIEMRKLRRKTPQSIPAGSLYDFFCLGGTAFAFDADVFLIFILQLCFFLRTEPVIDQFCRIHRLCKSFDREDP